MLFCGIVLVLKRHLHFQSSDLTSRQVEDVIQPVTEQHFAISNAEHGLIASPGGSGTNLPSEWAWTNGMSLGAAANGYACGVHLIQRLHAATASPSDLVVAVYVFNYSSDTMPPTEIRGLQVSDEHRFSIELYDPDGRPVEKTSYGRDFGSAPSQAELKRIYDRPKIISFLPPYRSYGYVNISRAFELKIPGKYVLRLQPHIITWPKVATVGLVCETVSLPEVVVDIQVKSEHLSQ